MDVAKASFDRGGADFPTAHRRQGRRRPHVGQLVGDDVGDAGCSLIVAVAGWKEGVLPERDAAEVLHRPGGEVGERQQVDLVARVRDAVVGLETSAVQKAPTSSPKPVRWPLPGTCTTRSGRRRRRRLGGLERADDEGHEIVLMTIVSANRTASWPPGGSRALDLGTVGHRHQGRVDHQGDAEDRFEVGLVPARERPPAVGGLHLGRGDDLLGARAASWNVLR